MDALDMLKVNLGFAHQTFPDARNTSDEQLQFVPEGGSHSIAWCLWHTAPDRGQPRAAGVPRGRATVERGLGRAHGHDRRATVRRHVRRGAQKVTLKAGDAFCEYIDAVWAEPRPTSTD